MPRVALVTTAADTIGQMSCNPAIGGLAKRKAANRLGVDDQAVLPRNSEIEAALQEYHGVHSCAVIGLPDEDKGNTVHAIIEADASTIDLDDLRTFLAERLVVYKLPRTFEFVDTPLRDDAGKVRRSALRAERLT